MIVIVEGIDRVGKTTLVDMLVKEGFAKLDNFEFPAGYDDRQLKTLIYSQRTIAQAHALKQVDKDLVIDRFHISQFVYSFVDRDIAANDMFEVVDTILQELNCLLIYVHPTDINESSVKHGKDLYMHQHMFNLSKQMTKLKYIETRYPKLKEAVDYVNSLR